MTKAKSRLTIQRPKNIYRKIKSSTILENNNSVKRPLSKTPLKSPYKSTSSFKSPPATCIKKRKVGSSRCLFRDITNIETNRNDQSPSIDSDDILFATPLSYEECVSFANQPNESAEERTEEKTQVLDELKALLPEVIAILASNGDIDRSILSFFQQVKDDRFPLNNMSFQLWLEVVRWFDNKSTTNMRYSDETKLFWKLGWRMFGERFLHFMGGFKSHGNVIQKHDVLGLFQPQLSEVNFAVPNVNVLRTFNVSNIAGERRPGIYRDMMSVLSSFLEHQSSCLTFDGKKLKMGLTDSSGDVDLLGHETGYTLAAKKEKLTRHIQEVTEFQGRINTVEADVTSMQDPALEGLRLELKALLTETVKRISADIFSIRDIRKKKEYCKLKLIERGGDSNWRKGRYVYAISAIIAFLHDIDEYLKKAYDVIEVIGNTIAAINNRLYTTEGTLNVLCHQSYVSIELQKEETPNQLPNTRHLLQRSQEWFELRSTAKVTGSTLYTALGGEGLKRQQDHFDKVICGVPEKEPKPEQKKMMEHGVLNEMNAVATVVGKVLPVFEPELKFYEEGCSTVSTETIDSFMVVSPDGSLRENNCFETTRVAIEIKCPYFNIHTRFPPRYLLQCLSEIEVLDVPYLLYISWTIEETTVFRVNRDRELFQGAIKLAYEMYGKVNVKKPTKYSSEQKAIKMKIEEKCKEVRMIGRFKSLAHSDNERINDNNTSMASTEYLTSLNDTLDDIRGLTEAHYEINRERASEAVVFLVSDLDRSWDKERVKWSPVSWFPKGYSLTTSTMREIAEDVHTRSHESGIHIPCSSFDGQWHGIVVRSNTGEPLTILQLQKDVWNTVIRMSKSEIVSEIKKLNRSPTWETKIVVENRDKNSYLPENHVIVASYGKVYPQFRRKETSLQTDATKDNSTGVNIERQQTLAHSIPPHVVDTSDSSVDVLRMTAVDENEELEAFLSNVNENNWADELLDDQYDPVDEPNEVIPDNQSESQQLRTQQSGHVTETFTQTQNQNQKNSREISFFNEQDYSCILSMFKTTKDSNKKHKWDNVAISELSEKFQSPDALKTLLDIELRIVVRYLKKTKGISLKESVSKQAKILELCRIIGLESPPPNDGNNRRSVKRRIDTLSDLASRTISRTHSKHDLSVWYSEYVWPERYNQWNSETGDITINGESQQWFYKPEYSIARNQYEVRCIDATHLLTRSRQKSCRGGLDGFSNEPWRTVAITRKTLLTKIMVDEVTDPMSVQMAKTHFSEQVECMMRTLNFEDCAQLCRDIRNWWNSEDTPGISANERLGLRQSLRKRLLSCANFSRFPPATVSMNGWPLQLWEALLANIDAKAFLYGLSHRGTYNVRSFSSMMGETFFSELVLHDKGGKGAVTSEEFGRFIGNTIEKVQARLDPKRTFAYRTSRTRVYDLVEDCESLPDNDTAFCRVCAEGCAVLPRNITPADHSFDMVQRKRLKGRTKPETVSTSRTAVQRGALGVRWERARRNESKMLLSDKMGI